MVGLDGSADSRRAAEWTASLCAALGIDAIATHVLGLLHRTPSGELVASDRHRDSIRNELQHWCAPLRDAGIEYQAMLYEGEPVAALLDAADELDVDLIVVGTHGAGNAPRSALGSTSRMLVQQTRRPVVVVPEPA
jgi:nucleotide-binding universal stress UspA family protein